MKDRAIKTEHPDVLIIGAGLFGLTMACLLYTSPSPRDVEESRMASYA